MLNTNEFFLLIYDKEFLIRINLLSMRFQSSKIIGKKKFWIVTQIIFLLNFHIFFKKV